MKLTNISYRYRTLRCVRYNINTGTGHFGRFGTTSIPVRTLGHVRYINTGTGHLGMFGTSIPVPDTSINSVRHQHQYLRYRYGSRYRYRYNINTDTGHFGKSGTTSTRYRHIVTSSLGAVAPRIHARKDTNTPVLEHLPVVRSVYQDTEHS